MRLSENQQKVIDSSEHLLVTGGPGSGKTTVSILKAIRIIKTELVPYQEVLFLSFANTSVFRVKEAIVQEKNISSEYEKQIRVETYHAFFWHIIKTHGYLIGLPRRLAIMPTSDEAVALSNIRSKLKSKVDSKLKYKIRSKLRSQYKKVIERRANIERKRLARDEGRICFKLFACLAKEILCNSKSIRSLVANKHPTIFVDEFQDTDGEEWNVIKALGEKCSVIALADPNQMIHAWRGASPQRIEHFRKKFSLKAIELGKENYRSPDKEIVAFANDILDGKFKKNRDEYEGVEIIKYDSGNKKHPICDSLYNIVNNARETLRNQNLDGWSLAILVTTKKMTRKVSDYLNYPKCPKVQIKHFAVVELEATTLAAEIIAFMLEPAQVEDKSFEKFIELLCNYLLGRGRDSPNSDDTKNVIKIKEQYETYKSSEDKIIRKNIRLNGLMVIYTDLCGLQLSFSGSPKDDWKSVRDVFKRNKKYKSIARDVKNFRLLERGERLGQELRESWLDNGAYIGALSIIKNCYDEDRFKEKSEPKEGIVIMNMHKAKGMQYDVVIIFEDTQHKHNVKYNEYDNMDQEVRNNLGVSITRAKQRVILLTPKKVTCSLFLDLISTG